MNGVISNTDYDLVVRLKETGVLTVIENSLKDTTAEGIILSHCADGDQRALWRKYLEQLLTPFGGEARVHALSLHAGAAVIPEDSPVAFEGEESRVMRRAIKEAIDLKGIHTVVLMVHWECGKCLSVGLTLANTLELLVRACQIIANENPSAKVLPAVSLNFGEVAGRTSVGMKTYKFVIDKFTRLSDGV